MNPFSKYENSTFNVSESNIYDLNNIIKDGEKTVFAYVNKGVTSVDVENYDASFTEFLLFEINPEIKEFDYNDEELETLNCTYCCTVLSNNLERKIRPISNGKISGKLENNKWRIKVDIDTGFNFGGYLDKQDSRKINLTEHI